MLTIIMYHYVRDLKHSKYPDIKGLEVQLFEEQISYIKKHYNIISAYTLMDAIISKEPLPPNAALLTFDDGYIDHFINVFPILCKHNISGSFFPPSKCVIENTILEVNKIHFLLAMVRNKTMLIEKIHEEIIYYKSEYNLDSQENYWIKYGVKSRFDTAEVMFIKNVLQKALPDKLRNLIINKLFIEFITDDEKSFATELYMNIDQIACLRQNGMYIGSHGHNHYWLDSLSEEQQTMEIDLSLQFIKDIGGSTDRWIMCYPYGAYNESLLRILKNKNCTAGLTTKVAIANLQNPLILSRLDTNDLPKNAKFNHNDCQWTKKLII